MRLGNAHLNQINMSRTKNNYPSAILQKRVPADLLPELREMVDIRVASFKREQAAKERMEANLLNVAKNA